MIRTATITAAPLALALPVFAWAGHHDASRGLPVWDTLGTSLFVAAVAVLLLLGAVFALADRADRATLAGPVVTVEHTRWIGPFGFRTTRREPVTVSPVWPSDVAMDEPW